MNVRVGVSILFETWLQKVPDPICWRPLRAGTVAVGLNPVYMKLYPSVKGVQFSYSFGNLL